MQTYVVCHDPIALIKNYIYEIWPPIINSGYRMTHLSQKQRNNIAGEAEAISRLLSHNGDRRAVSRGRAN